jgi:hypothetical protein
MKVKLTPKEATVLREALAQAGFNEAAITPTEKGVLLDGELATEIREICADYLMQVGFDEDYVATEKGLVLESLMDKFFVP